MVERLLAKEKVAGSTPVSRSTEIPTDGGRSFTVIAAPVPVAGS